MKICIRDDDTSYFTKPEDLEKAYDFIKNGPVSLSIVPCTIPVHKDCVYPYGEGIEYKQYPIGDNKELVEYIKNNKNKYDILLHGFSHEYKKVEIKGQIKWESELKWKNQQQLYEELYFGKKYIEDLFESKVNVFVAPNNHIGKKAMQVVEELNMDFSGIIYFNDRNLSCKYIANFIYRWLYRLFYKIQIPKILNYGKHKELVAYGLDNIGKLKYEYNKCKEEGTPFVIYTHYWDVNKNAETKNLLKEIYQYAIMDGAKLVKLTDCFAD